MAPEPPQLFHDYLRAVLSATYHRTAAMMSSPKGVETLYEGAKWCSENTELGGHVEWIIPKRMFVWRGANVYGIDTSTLRFIGIGREIDRFTGKLTSRVTIIMRVGWYKMHLAVAKALGLSPKRFPP
jgi:hypothetical protein